MKTIQVEIRELSPLMMHGPASMLTAPGSTKSRLDRPDTKQEAERGAYRMKSGELYIPATALFGAILGGLSFRKVGKYSGKSIFAGNLRVEPEQVGLGTKAYEVDLRTVVIQQGKKRNRIVRARPRLDSRTAAFQIIFNDKFIQDAEIIRVCLEGAGARVGLLEFRPQMSGAAVAAGAVRPSAPTG